MDWIRLTKSGKDLAGTGGKILQVTHGELRKHNKRKDCWIALNGIVYNVTPYMDFHPGGWDELIRHCLHLTFNVDSTFHIIITHGCLKWPKHGKNCLAETAYFLKRVYPRVSKNGKVKMFNSYPKE